MLLFKTEEMARRVKDDLEMREAEFDVDFWAERPKKPEEEVVEEKKEKSEEKMVLPKEEEKLENDNKFASLTEL